MSGIEQQANPNTALDSALESSRLGAAHKAAEIPLDLEEVAPVNPEVSSVVDSERKKAMELETQSPPLTTETAQPAKLEERVERIPEESRPRTRHPIARAAYRATESMREEQQEKREGKTGFQENTDPLQVSRKIDLKRTGRNLIHEGNLRVANQQLKDTTAKQEIPVTKDTDKTETEIPDRSPLSVSIPVTVAVPKLESNIELPEPKSSETENTVEVLVPKASSQTEDETYHQQVVAEQNLDLPEVVAPEGETPKEESPRTAAIVTEDPHTAISGPELIETIDRASHPQTPSREPDPITISEPLEIPQHLIKKLNLLNHELKTRQEQVEPASAQPAREPEQISTQTEKPAVRVRREQVRLEPLPSHTVAADAKIFGSQQMDRQQLSLDQALKLDLSQAQIGKIQNTQPLSFRGHSIGSGTPLDRLITHIADFIKRIEMQLLRFLTRRYQDKKKRPRQVVKARTKEEEDELLLASFSSTLARNRKKRYRLLSALERLPLFLKRE